MLHCSFAFKKLNVNELNKKVKKYVITIRIADNGCGKTDEKFFLLRWLHTSERSLHSSPTFLAAMFTASTRPANGTSRIKPRNKSRRPSLVSFSLYEDDSTRSRPQTRVSRPFLRPLKRTEIRFISQEMVDIFGTSRAWPMGINRAVRYELRNIRMWIKSTTVLLQTLFRTNVAKWRCDSSGDWRLTILDREGSSLKQ